MEFLDDRLLQYAEKHSSAETNVLQELNRHTHAQVMMPRMLSGHLQGRILSMISKMKQPQRILEIGTYTGYSALCLAEGLAENGRLHTIDVNDELETVSRQFIGKSAYADKIVQHFGDARVIIPGLQEKFDLVFIDADKESYGLYYDMLIDKMESGGLIIADNVLWSGKVLDETALNKDKDTRALHLFNQHVQADERVENVLLPVRDGLMLIRKK